MLTYAMYFTIAVLGITLVAEVVYLFKMNDDDDK